MHSKDVVLSCGVMTRITFRESSRPMETWSAMRPLSASQCQVLALRAINSLSQRAQPES